MTLPRPVRAPAREPMLAFCASARSQYAMLSGVSGRACADVGTCNDTSIWAAQSPAFVPARVPASAQGGNMCT
eukprot:5408693-Lingulodinium_polyedra.AAC.1